ncbi:MAG TPA: hypothetical protein VIH90_00095 [Candidatus Saccharimonadales bacterium]
MNSKEPNKPERTIRARGIRRNPPDLRMAARAFIALAQELPPDWTPPTKRKKLESSI